MTSSVLNTVLLCLGDMQERDLSCFVPGQGPLVRLWAGCSVALTPRPQPFCQRGSCCLFHKHFSGEPDSGPGGGTVTPTEVKQATGQQPQ